MKRKKLIKRLAEQLAVRNAIHANTKGTMKCLEEQLAVRDAIHPNTKE